MDLLCKWCDEVKPAEQFLKRNASEPYSQGNVRCCRACNASRNRARYSTDPRVREVQLAATARWQREHRDEHNARVERFAMRNPFNQQARNRVGYLLRTGAWTKQPCCVCGALDGVEAHHDSYARPHWEAVRWLCKAHHERWHQQLDPLKAPLIEGPLDEAAAKRMVARKKLDEINRLRKEASALQNAADDIEMAAWTRVQQVAAREFPKFLKKESA